jgi:hypothetical protein
VVTGLFWGLMGIFLLTFALGGCSAVGSGTHAVFVNGSFPPIAEIRTHWQFHSVTPSIQGIAEDWIAYARYADVRDAPEQIAADAQSMVELPHNH